MIDFCEMRKLYKTPVFQYALILCLAIVLLFGQTFKLHMHIQYNDAPSPTIAEHIIDVHATSLLHDTTHIAHKQGNIEDHHHSAGIDLSSNSFSKKTELLNLFVLILLIVSLFLYVPRLRYNYKQYIVKTKLTSLYCLLHPPLRAPPA